MNDTQFEKHPGNVVSPMEFRVVRAGVGEGEDPNPRPTSTANAATSPLVYDSVTDLRQSVSSTTYVYTLGMQTPALALAEGKYNVQVKAKDTYNHNSQTLWSFYVDRTSPSINIDPIYVFSPKPVSENIPLRIRYNLSDNLSPFMNDVNYAIKDKNGQTVAMLPSANRLSAGDQWVTWNGMASGIQSVQSVQSAPLSGSDKVVDGVYTLEITAKDQAGNVGRSTQSFVLDSTPPSINYAGFDHPVMTLKWETLTFRVETNETANAVLKITPKSVTSNQSSYVLRTPADGSVSISGSDSVKMYPISIVCDPATKKYVGTFMWSYSAGLNTGLADGAYRWELEATDLAGNTGL
jgi:hypothetical protein